MGTRLSAWVSRDLVEDAKRRLGAQGPQGVHGIEGAQGVRGPVGDPGIMGMRRQATAYRADGTRMR